MTQHKVERAVVTGAEAVGSALEMFERRLIERFNNLLDAERTQWLDVRDMVAAVAIEIAETRKESNLKRDELLAGIHGLQQQISEQDALFSPDERIKIAAMVYRHEEDVIALKEKQLDHERRIDALEAARDG
jgi:hypothetical protein